MAENKGNSSSKPRKTRIKRNSRPTRELETLPLSPIQTLPFDRAQRCDEFAGAIGEHYQTLIGAGPDAANALLQGVAVENMNGARLFKMSKAGQKLVRENKAALARHVKTGRDLPYLVDRRSGKAIEQLKGVGAKSIKIAELSALVISVAHVISGMDVAKKLSVIDRKLDRLLQGRRIDQLAKLEQVYRAARERLSRPLAPEDVNVLRQYREELLCLRATWRREFEAILSSAPDPDKSGLFERRVSVERKVEADLVGAVDRIHLLKTNFLMDICLADVTNTLDRFIERTVPDELKLLETTARQLQLVGGRIKNEKVRRSVKDIQEGLAGLTQMLFGLNAAVLTCPACDTRLRVPAARHLQITCPSCRTSFERET